jgi:hypothetical protein
MWLEEAMLLQRWCVDDVVGRVWRDDADVNSSEQRHLQLPRCN